MIRDNQITVVVQGDVRPNTAAVLRQVRATTPGAHILFSSFPNLVTPAQRAILAEWVDEWVWSVDPGSLPPTTHSTTAPRNNVNRLLLSTATGLHHVRTRYALKLRSDAQVDVRAIANLWWHNSDPADGDRRQLVPSRYTRHPSGINGYLFHISDWLGFGTTAQMRDYWSTPAFGETDASWFDKHEHQPGATATARRFRARLTQEQWIACTYARRHGYLVPAFLDERSPPLLAAYRRFLSRECVIADSAQIGLVLPTHAWAENSLFQRLDCVSHQDWRQLCRTQAAETGTAMQDPLRLLARGARHAIARGVLMRKWLKSRRAAQVLAPHDTKE